MARKPKTAGQTGGAAAAGFLGRLANLFRRRRKAQAAARPNWQWSYRCDWTDAATGERIHSEYVRVITQSSSNYQQASAAARRLATQQMSNEYPALVARTAGAVYRCTRVGAPVNLP